MSEFDEYIRQGEPERSEKAAAWQTAIGLQDVDGLKPSKYLIETAKRHIEGDITIDDVKSMLDSYYKSKTARIEVESERTEEADKVRANYNNYPKRIGATDEYLVLFFRNLILGEHNDLRNRDLLVHVTQSDNGIPPKGQNDTLNLTLEEVAIVKLLKENKFAKQSELALLINKSDRTVKRIMDSLKEKNVIERKNGKRNGYWEVKLNVC